MSASIPSQLSLRGFDRKLDRAIRALARSQNVSRNKAALILLRRGAGLEEPAHGGKPADKTVGHALDRYFAVWTKEEAKRFDASVAIFEQVDADMWK